MRLSRQVPTSALPKSCRSSTVWLRGPFPSPRFALWGSPRWMPKHSVELGNRSISADFARWSGRGSRYAQSDGTCEVCDTVIRQDGGGAETRDDHLWNAAVEYGRAGRRAGAHSTYVQGFAETVAGVVEPRPAACCGRKERGRRWGGQDGRGEEGKQQSEHGVVGGGWASEWAGCRCLHVVAF